MQVRNKTSTRWSRTVGTSVTASVQQPWSNDHKLAVLGPCGNVPTPSGALQRDDGNTEGLARKLLRRCLEALAIIRAREAADVSLRY